MCRGQKVKDICYGQMGETQRVIVIRLANFGRKSPQSISDPKRPKMTTLQFC